MKKLLYILPFLLAGPVIGQVEQPVRYEIEHRQRDNYYMVQSADEFGVVVFREEIKRARGRDYIWELIMLDTELEERWKREIVVDKNFLFSGYSYQSGQLALMFRMSGKRKSNFHIVRVNLIDGMDTRFEVENLLPIELDDFLLLGNSVAFAGYVNSRPTIFLYGFEDQKVRVLPGFYGKVSSIMDLHVDEVHNLLNVLISERNERNEYVIRVKSYNVNGELVADQTVTSDPRTKLITGKATSFYDNRLAITGTYGSVSDYAEGIFFAMVAPDGTERVNYYTFAELEHYFDYLPDKKEARVEDRVTEKRRKGKEYKVKTRMVMHELVKEGDEYIMLGEVYDILYDNDWGTSFTGDPYGYYSPFNSGYRGYANAAQRYRRYNEVFGFEYSHAVLVGFDENGQRIWDASLRIEDVEKPYLEQVVSMTTHGKDIGLVYKYEDELRYKAVGQVLDGKEYQVDSIRMMNPTDELRYNDDNYGELVYWYGDYFLVYGFQKIYTKYMNQNRRQVFYINKIKFN